MTMMLLLYYIAVSVANEVLEVDYRAVIIQWWNKPLKRNRKCRKKLKHRNKKKLVQPERKSGRKVPNIKFKCQRTRSVHQRGRWRSALYVLYSYFCGSTHEPTSRNMDRLLYACTSTTSTMTPRAKEKYAVHENSTETYDSDSAWIGIDSLSTYCITNSMNDYINKPTPIRQNIKGINDTPAQITGVGRGCYKILDNKGRQHTFVIDKLYYCATSPMKILSPQHLDMMWKAKDPQHRLMSAVDSDGCILRWTRQQKEFTKFIPINPKTGVPMFKSSPGYQKMHRYMASNPDIIQDDQAMCCQAPKSIEDDESVSSIQTPGNEASNYPPMVFEGEITPKRSNVTINTRYEHDKPIIIEFGDENMETKPLADTSEMDPTSEMLYLHYKLGHISFQKIRQMAKDGLVPKKFLKCRIPMCASCMYGSATKRPWRTKQPINQIQHRRNIIGPGDCISVDQFESPVPGMIAHIKGKPTIARYKVGTVFVDHFSDIMYVHFQKTSSEAETIEAKEAFERWSRSHGVNIKHYHADNGRFAENAFMQHVDKCNQTISFCGVNAHFQNGRAERRIRTLQDLTRCQLLHAKMRWPSGISTCLWPYALKNVVDILNDTPNKCSKISRVEVFAKTEVRPNLRHHHHFGVPTYVLDDRAQAGHKLSKWLAKARLGIYLGKSPRHSRSVALILNPSTGHVSPQFHVRFDDVFETVKGKIDPYTEDGKHYADLPVQTFRKTK
jgi:hypothetical protein